ncbi:lipase [Nocardioides sp. zg-ZUI104]|uniref:esterase/lipase family protein n=1 Tax=Nocardioides faecalis TaxID=2803858 RepID=UPI001BCA9CB1|nr:alpha/beta fold hydrolase [Nocardioides faecalis]MBS4754458.1 lipase [Nocardioides faecalis]
MERLSRRTATRPAARPAGLLAGVLVTAVALLATLTLAAPRASAAPEPLPVPYGFVPGALLNGLPGANAAGTNDWSCKPSKAHPRPVVLVHGFAGNRATNWPTFGPLLKNEGYCVFALTYGVAADVVPVNLLGGVGDMRASAGELKVFVDKVLKATGAGKVDLVGHSEGSLMPNWYLKYLGGAKKVHHFIGLGSAFGGTNLPVLFERLLNGILAPEQVPVCQACLQFSPKSQFVRQLHEGGLMQKGVSYTSIVTRIDELVIPYTNGILPGARNYVLQDVCPQDLSDHLQIVSSRNVARIVLNTLDPKNARKLTCVPVLPVVGELVPGLI